MAITNEMTFFVVFSDCCQFVGKLVFMSLCKLILYVIASLKSFHSNVLCLVTQSCPTLCDPMYCSPPGSSVHGDSPGKNTGVGCHALLQGDLPNPGIQSRSPALQVVSLPAELPGKPFHSNSLSIYYLYSFRQSKILFANNDGSISV